MRLRWQRRPEARVVQLAGPVLSGPTAAWFSSIDYDFHHCVCVAFHLGPKPTASPM